MGKIDVSVNGDHAMKKIEDLQIILGGPQGSGLETTAQVLTYALSYLGYGILSDREYFSNIKGKHSYIHTRVSSKEFPKSLSLPVDIVGGLDAETVFTHFDEVRNGGFLIVDKKALNTSLMMIPSMEKELKNRLLKKARELGISDKLADFVEHVKKTKNVTVIYLDSNKILADARKKLGLTSGEANRYVSSVLMGAVIALIGTPMEAVVFGLERRFKGKQKIIENNREIIQMVIDKLESEVKNAFTLAKPNLNKSELMVVSGNDITAIGKIVGGLRFQSYYPITPAADESFYIEEKEWLKTSEKDIGSIVVFQTEDEIAAITSAIGAALAGARSATATSGPGFSLMAEALGWAGINEVPVVITYYQRGGPSTGLPTRGGQSDLLFSLFASHGEFPRIVIASGDHMEAFHDAIDAFNYAERYQLPVIHLLDKFLANSFVNMPVPEVDKLEIDRGYLTEGGPNYKRFDLSNPISPRAFLGSNAIMWYTGDEHDEFGHISEDPENRVKMFDKRMKKLEIADREIPLEKRAIYYGDSEADVLLVGWGYTKGPALDAIEQLSSEGIKAGYLHVKMFVPFPVKLVQNVINKFDLDKVIAVEHSYEAQVAKIINMNLGTKISREIVKYTGRPIYSHEVIRGVKKILDGERRVVLKDGA